MTETPPYDYIAQANFIHENGPYRTPPSTLYFTYLKPDGESFIGRASGAEMYLREGYTITGEQTIEDVDVWNEAQSAKAAPQEASAEASEDAEKHAKRSHHAS